MPIVADLLVCVQWYQDLLFCSDGLCVLLFTEIANRQMGSDWRLKNRVFYGWVIVGASLVIILILVGIRFSFGVFFKSLELEFGLNRAATSSVFSAYMIMAAVFGMVNGWALDRYGPKLVLALMGLFTGLGLLITGFTSSLWQLFISYSLLVAVGTAGAVPLLISIISRWFGKRRGIAVGIATSGTGLGTIILAPLAAYLIDTVGWRESYIWVGVVGGLVVMALAMFLRRSAAESGVLPDGVMSLNGSAGLIGAGDKFKLTGLSFRQAVSTRSFWLLLFVWLLFAFCLGLVTTHIVPYATDAGISTLEASTVLSVMGGSQILARLAVGRISDVTGRKLPGFTSALFGIGALIWVIWSDNLSMFYVFAVCFGICYGGFAVVNLTMVGDSFGGHSLGTIMGIMNVGYSAGLAIGSALGGFIFDVTGSYVVAFTIAAVVMLITGLLVIFVRSEAAIYHKQPGFRL